MSFKNKYLYIFFAEGVVVYIVFNLLEIRMVRISSLILCLFVLLPPVVCENNSERSSDLILIHIVSNLPHIWFCRVVHLAVCSGATNC